MRYYVFFTDPTERDLLRNTSFGSFITGRYVLYVFMGSSDAKDNKIRLSILCMILTLLVSQQMLTYIASILKIQTLKGG